MNRDNPLRQVLVWAAIGFAVGVIFVLAIMNTPSSQETNDEVLDALARQSR